MHRIPDQVYLPYIRKYLKMPSTYIDRTNIVFGGSTSPIDVSHERVKMYTSPPAQRVNNYRSRISPEKYTRSSKYLEQHNDV